MAQDILSVNRISVNTDYHLDKKYFYRPLRFGDFLLYQIGRAFANGKTVVDSHIQPDLFELTVITKGKGRIYTNSIGASVERGDIYLSFPCDIHKIESDVDDPLQFDFIAFTCDSSDLRDELEKIMENHLPPASRVVRDERINSLLGHALAEIMSENEYSEELLSAIFKQLTIYLVRCFKDLKGANKLGPNDRSEALCYRIMNYIDTHIYSLNKLDDLADVTGYSYSYLSALFKKHTSNTLSFYFREKKLDVARLLIEENRKKITEISELLRYSSVYAFSKAFSARFGLSPRAYQRTNAKPSAAIKDSAN